MPQTRKFARAARPEEPVPSRSQGKPKAKHTSKSNTREPSSGEGEIDNDSQDSVYTGEDEESEKGEISDAYDSDAIDKDDFVLGAKRKRNASASASNSSRSPKKIKTVTSQKGRAKLKKAFSQDDDENELDVEDGQEVVVPPGRISENTLNFLTQLKDPKCNDRQWFKLHEPVYRQAEKEWKAFVEAITDQIMEADPQVPPLPPKDLIHRIYRDIRFSNDKTPYKGHFSASFSRSGRKGIWAKSNIQRRAGADRLREVISAPEFVAYFGEPQPSQDSSRQSIFGREDELKVAPKGVDKKHSFLDSEVLAEGFAETVGKVVRVMRPFVHWLVSICSFLDLRLTVQSLNDMMTVAGADTDNEGGDDSVEND
ncbi:hypothetical protein C0992_012029 [Termitomyces sp. T32_za158]|nr:hypothetical protein C0992_012029 [Termitomyces sp. T32_za158]